MTPIERLELENDLAIINFLLYPGNPDDLINQKNKIIEALAPQSMEQGYEGDVTRPKKIAFLGKDPGRRSQTSQKEKGE